MKAILRALIVVAVVAVGVGGLAGCVDGQPAEPVTESSAVDSPSCSLVATDSVAAAFGRSQVRVIDEETKEIADGEEHSCGFASSASTWMLSVLVKVYSFSAAAQELLDSTVLKQQLSATRVDGVGDEIIDNVVR